MDAFTFPKTLTRRLDRVARDTGAHAETLVRDAVKEHLDYLEWLGKSLDEAEKEAQEVGWLSTDDVRRTLAAEQRKRPRGRTCSR
jgi:predicted transcriptional regulator